MDPNDSMVQLAKFAGSFQEKLFALEEVGLIFNWLQGNKNILWSKKLETHLPTEYPSSIISSWDILKRDLIHAKDAGVFDRFKIGDKYNNNHVKSK